MANYLAAALIAAASLWLLRPPQRPAPRTPELAADAEETEVGAPGPAAARAGKKKALRILLIERTTLRRRDDGSTSEVVRTAVVVGDGESRLAAIDGAEPAPAALRSLGERVVAGLPCVGSLRTPPSSSRGYGAPGDYEVEEWRGKKTHRLVRRVSVHDGGARTETVDFYLLSRRASAAMFARVRKGKL